MPQTNIPKAKGRIRSPVTLPENSRAYALCDGCKFLTYRDELRQLMDYRGGTSPVWTGYLVCPECEDTPNAQFAPPLLKPDPVPVYQPRPDDGFQPYLVAHTGQPLITNSPGDQPPPYSSEQGVFTIYWLDSEEVEEEEEEPLWTPYDLGAALGGWWDVDNHGTPLMTDDGAGLISLWRDQNAGIAVTGATTARPTWTSTAWRPAGSAAKAGVTFNGTTNFLFTDTGVAGLPTGSAAGNIFVSAQTNTPSPNFGVLIVYGGTDGIAADTREMYIDASIGQFVIDNFVTELFADGVISPGSYNIFGASWVGALMGGRINGAFTNPVAVTTGALNTSTTRLVLGANISLGTPAALVYRQVIVTRALTWTQRQQLEGWLAWDGWDTAASNPLPADHPYKDQPPRLA